MVSSHRTAWPKEHFVNYPCCNNMPRVCSVLGEESHFINCSLDLAQWTPAGRSEHGVRSERMRRAGRHSVHSLLQNLLVAWTRGLGCRDPKMEAVRHWCVLGLQSACSSRADMCWMNGSCVSPSADVLGSPGDGWSGGPQSPTFNRWSRDRSVVWVGALGMLTAGAGWGGVAHCWYSFLELSLGCFFSICIVTSNWSYEFDHGASLSHLFSLFSFLLSLCDVKPWAIVIFSELVHRIRAKSIITRRGFQKRQGEH